MKRISLILLFLLSHLHGFNSIQAIVLAAGRSSRFDGPITKLATPVCGVPMVLHPIKVATHLQLPVTLVLGHQKKLIKQLVKDAGYTFDFVIQEEQRGTGHALQCSQEKWTQDHILVLNGDMPMVEVEHIKAICQMHIQENADVTFGISYNVDPDGAFGRIVETEKGIFIVEKKEFIGYPDDYYLDYPTVNSGIYIFKKSYLEKNIDKLTPNEKTKEYNITDLVNMANDLGAKMCTAQITYHFGANTKEDLKKVEQAFTKG